MADPLILALDQGTTSSRAIVFDREARIVALAQAEFPQIYPHEGWVEHDPEAIWSTTLKTAREAMQAAEAKGGKVSAIGIANQRETTIVWDRKSGEAIHNVIVWQDRRTAAECRKLERDGHLEEVRERTGLLLDPYFSATKIAWILDHVDGARGRAERGELAFGTIDAFLLWRLTGGRVHATDPTNACRTSLFDIHEGAWSDPLCDLFGVPCELLPEVRDNSGDFGETDADLLGRPLSILGMVGDQQGATIGQGGFSKGDVKATFGTGGFVLANTGEEPLVSANRLLSTVAYRLEGKTTYALEGSIFTAGAAVQWLRDGLGLVEDAAATEAMASGLDSNGGVYLVPAFTGLGAPHWDPDARGAIFGLTRGTGRAQLVRATLESVCYQTRDLLQAMQADGVSPNVLKVDGGFAANAWAMQFLADILDRPVERPEVLETTALGAAYLAGRAARVYGDLESFRTLPAQGARYEPAMKSDDRERLLAGWRDAVERTLSSRPADDDAPLHAARKL